MKILTIICIGIIMVLIGGIIVLPVSAAEYKQINVNVYAGINPNGNPVHEQPHDIAEFPHIVTYVERIYQMNEFGERLGPYTERSYYVGYYPASNTFSNAFPIAWGKPYTTNPYRTCWMWMCWYQQEETFYHIQPVNTPAGYCPMYPDGENYKKDDTTTVNMKYYYGNECNNGVLPTPDPNRRKGGIIILR